MRKRKLKNKNQNEKEEEVNKKRKMGKRTTKQAMRNEKNICMRK